MGRTLLGVLVIAAVLLVVVWTGWKLGGWAARYARERRLATAKVKAIWYPFRRPNERGQWVAGVELRHKETVIRTIFLTEEPLPLGTDAVTLIELDGEALTYAGRLNNSS